FTHFVISLKGENEGARFWGWGDVGVSEIVNVGRILFLAPVLVLSCLMASPASAQMRAWSFTDFPETSDVELPPFDFNEMMKMKDSEFALYLSDLNRYLDIHETEITEL